MTFHYQLAAMNACPDAQEWAADYETLQSAWDDCPRGDWMLWLIAKTGGRSDELKLLIMCLCDVARTALAYTEDPRVLACVETGESWCKGETTQEHARTAAGADDVPTDVADAASFLATAAGAVMSMAMVDADNHHADIVRKHFPIAPEIKEAK